MTRLVLPARAHVPAFADVIELAKPVTWFPPMWAFGCGIVSSGVVVADRWPLVMVGIALTGPLVCGTSQMVNDWYDRHVDAVNEPNRPIPSGRIPGRWGLGLGLAGTAVSAAVAATAGWLVLAATLAALALAWAYSAPPLRLKTSGWWGPLSVGLSYEGLAWFTGAAAMLGGWPPAPVLVILVLYSLGAHGIMTLNDFKAVEGDRACGIRSLPVTLGPERAARFACWVMAVPQVAVVAVLLTVGAPIAAAVVATSLLLQLTCMARLVRDPRALAPWYNGTGVTLYVLGMLAAAFGLGGAGVIGWFGIIRLGLVQTAIGAMVMLSTSLLNRVMVVEYALAAAVPSALVAWHYAVQLSRPLWGHGSDRAARRTPWIVGGMGVLALGSLAAVNLVPMLGAGSIAGIAGAILAYTLIGAGVGAAGTSLLALLASVVAPERRAAAAALTWIMMVAGIAASAGIAGSLLDPFSPERLALVAGGLVLIAFLLSIVATIGLERTPAAAPPDDVDASFAEAISEMRGDPEAVRFTLFVFVSMLAYSMQDLILEPFAGLVFGLSPGASTQLAGVQHGGVLLGMVAAGVGGSAFGRGGGDLMRWVVAGCLGSALALAALAASASAAPDWPLALTVFVLGAMNGVFAVAAIGTMMRLAGAGLRSKAGVRMGVWGAAQAVAFGAGGMTGAVAADVARALIGDDAAAFALVFTLEAGLFLVAAGLALRIGQAEAATQGSRVWTATTQS